MSGLSSGHWQGKKIRKEGDTLENGCEKGRMRIFNNSKKGKVTLKRNSENE